MTSDWTTTEYEKIRKQILNNTGQEGEPSAFQEYVISLLSSLMQGSLLPNDSTLEELAQQIFKSGKPRADAWHDFLNLLYSAVMSTSSDSLHQHLVPFVFALANFDESKHVSSSSSAETYAPEAEGNFNMQEFGWIARDLWNGPQGFTHVYESREAAQRAWVNLNRFMAHMSVQQRLTPVESFEHWLEDFGLWTISDGLEARDGALEYGEPASVWLVIAGSDIHGDSAWGSRNGNPLPGIPLRQGEIWENRLEEGATQAMRWEFWKERLGEIARNGELDALISETMKLAALAMDRV
ncbi:hypothetical protein N431DRAFT_450646 [Stipitochalara longipes BDJ]|nr:hypothetical protein N431DRAFT_450646 [Stipitochalara longipes BDJ]